MLTVDALPRADSCAAGACAATPDVGRLRYIGLGDSSGYAVAAAALVRALRDAQVDVAWEPMLPGGGLGLGYAPAQCTQAGPSDLWPLRADARDCDTVIVHFVPEYYPVFIERERARGARRIVGHTVWETDALPAHWPALINQLDAVIVPTEWNRTIFRASGVTVPIWVLPHLPRPAQALLPAHQQELHRHLPSVDGRLVFYTIATWLERKAIEPLIEAFAQAFDADAPVALVIKTTAHDLERVRRDPGHEGEPLPVQPQFEAMVGRAVLRHQRCPAPIHLVTPALSDGALHALHALGDCFVSLARAEGWGLGAFEAALAGRPVIVTGWGGPTAFLDPDATYFVDSTRQPVRPAEPNASYTPDQHWAEPDIASAVQALQAVARDPQAAARRGEAGARHLRASIVPNEVAQVLIGALAALPLRPVPVPAAVEARVADIAAAPRSVPTRWWRGLRRHVAALLP